MTDFSIRIDNKNCRNGDPIPRAGFRDARLNQAKGTDNISLRVCEQRVGNTFSCREPFVNTYTILGDKGDIVAKLLKFLMFCVPGDRLAFAVGSPIQ